MNILIIISSLKLGGAEKQAVLDANLLAEKHRVFLYYFGDGPLKSLVHKGVNAELIEKKGYLATALRLREKIKENQIEIVHASLFAPIALSSLATIGTATKVIWHFHSHEYDIPLKSKLAFRWLAKLPNVRKVLFVNHELLDYFSTLNFPKAKTGVHYNHSELSGASRKPSAPRESTVHIGYLGRVVGLKRVHYLIDLADYLAEKEVVAFLIHIVGDGEALSRLKDQVRDRQLAEFFEFHGFQTDVVKYYQRFDLFVNPSQEECLSIAMIDAGMMSLPMVAFDVGGNNEIIRDGETGFIVKTKDELLKKCLILVQDNSLREQLGAAGQQHCRSLFSREKHADTLQNLYKELVDVA